MKDIISDILGSFTISSDDEESDNKEIQRHLPSLKWLQYQDYNQGDFVAIDFEIAYDCSKEGLRFPCQIGIAVVKNKKIVKSLSFLVKPPHNKWSNFDILWHRKHTNLSPKSTEDAPEFNELWPEMKQYFDNQFILAHNAKSVEIDVLEKCFDYYGIEYPKIKGYLCTMELLGEYGCSAKLNDLCERYYIDFNEDIHHDAEQDAIACAKLFIAYLNGVKPMSVEEFHKKHNTPLEFNFGGTDNGSSEISENDIQLPTILENPQFTGKRIVLTGDFSLTIKGKRIDFSHKLRDKVIKQWIETMGAKVTSSISSRTDIVIEGKFPGKQEKIQEQIAHGHKIEVLNMEILDDLILSAEQGINNINKENPLYKRKFAILGDYTAEQEKEIRIQLQKRGAVLTQKQNGKYNITRTTHYCILYDNVTKEDIDLINNFAFDGYHIIKVPVSELPKLFSEDIGNYYSNMNIVRNLRINKDFLSNPRFRPVSEGRNLNPFSTKEIYVGKGIKGDLGILSQLIGNIGGYANQDFNDDTQIILLSDVSVKHLTSCEKDETIEYIENTYNAGKDSLGTFTYKIITESDLLNWIKDWIVRFNIKDSTLKYYNSYMEQYSL